MVESVFINSRTYETTYSDGSLQKILIKYLSLILVTSLHQKRRVPLYELEEYTFI